MFLKIYAGGLLDFRDGLSTLWVVYVGGGAGKTGHGGRGAETGGNGMILDLWLSILDVILRDPCHGMSKTCGGWAWIQETRM